ncbi:MAG: copper resistance protein B [Sulfurovum sp.]|nr:MAG: copper resistance protein B [Sulfurovum sp.]
MKTIILIQKFLLLAAATATLVHGEMNDDPLRTMLLMDKFEIYSNSEHTRRWEGSLSAQYDLNKLILYSDGEATSEGLQQSQNELVYSRAIAPFWDLQTGIVYDKNANANRIWGEVAISGLAPYWFETRAALLFNTEGNIGARVDLEYELLLTQRLILTPSLEADLYTKDDPKMLTGSGLSSIEAGLRLRYEIRREFSPYIGVTYEKNFGNTRHFNSIEETNFVIGIRVWF